MKLITLANAGTLINDDNTRHLASLPSTYSVVSDPPYGIGYVHSGGGRGKHPRRIVKAVANDDVPFDPTPLMRFERVVIFGANHYAKRLPDGGSWQVWDKRGNGRGPDDKFADAEFMWVNARIKTRVFNYLWKGICQDGEKGQRRSHPTQKPIALMAWCIRHFTPAGSTIFDPYMGCGSTGIAALRAGRRFVGIELDPAHFEIAQVRMKAERARLQKETANAAA